MSRTVHEGPGVGVGRLVPRTGTAVEVVRFGIVGVAVNVTLYLAYLMLIHAGIDYRVAMSAVYVAGTVLGFVLHRSWTFRSKRAWGGAFGRYLIAYAAGYALNLAGLWLLVEAVDLSHALAQGVMILVVAAFLFMIQKLWIFPKVS